MLDRGLLAVMRKLLKPFFFSVLLAGIFGAAWIFFSNPHSSLEMSSTALEPELSIKSFDEPFSVPSIGTSLFDKTFSVKNPTTGIREYEIPYPFTRLIEKLKEASGGVSPKITLFPMGRSLQRSAAIEGMKELKNLDPFYRFPRIVLGFTDDSIGTLNKIPMNYKEKLYVGMNERAKILEVISYNDEAGRFEYQVVRDYEAGKRASAVYVNRQLCLTCHQNQTPIFSRAPWSESNANTAMQDELHRVLKQNFGEKPCSENPHQVFCYQMNQSNREFYYWGSPVIVDQQVPYALDLATKFGNSFHAYHKIYQRACSDLECRKSLLKQILIYKLTDQKGILQTPEVRAFHQAMITKWRTEFPNGLSLPDAAIPNRNPLVNQRERGRENLELLQGRQTHVKSDLEQVLANSDVPGEFEPLLTRGVSEVWQDPMLNPAMSRLVFGYSSFFTASDARMIDQLLMAKAIDISQIDTVATTCSASKSGTVNLPEIVLKCSFDNTRKGLQFSSFLKTVNGSKEIIGSSRQIKVQFPTQTCRPEVLATPENVLSGAACAPFENSVLRMRQNQDGSAWIYFQTQSGLSVRSIDGRRLGPILIPALNFEEEKTFQVNAQLISDLQPLSQALEAAFSSGDFKKYVDGPALNRITVLAMVLKFLGSPNDELTKLQKEMLTLKKMSEAPEDELGELPLQPRERAMAHANRNCAACHFNREGVPPAFLGGPTQTLGTREKCLKLATCSPRMLYRLKMWECSDSEHDIKKTPMPPMAFARGRISDLPHWIQTDRKQLIESLKAVFPANELIQYLIQGGMSRDSAVQFAADLQRPSCPIEKSTGFEKLPRCDHEVTLNTGACN